MENSYNYSYDSSFKGMLKEMSLGARIIYISGIIVLIASVFLLIFSIFTNTTLNGMVEITIQNKYIEQSGNIDIYLVVDEGNNIYEINNIDLYNQLEIGETYKITYTEYKSITGIEM